MKGKQYRALLVDVDGTLVCARRKQPTPQAAAALRGLQERGVTVMLATGRTMMAVRPEVMSGIHPDYYVCMNGAYVADGAGKTLFHHPMSRRQFDDVLALARREGCPLGFAFRECYYTYEKDEIYRPFYERVNGDMVTLRDGTEATRHLQDLPYAAFGILPPDKLPFFTDPALGLHVTAFDKDVYDICQPDVNKATGVRQLLETAGLTWQDVVAVGDGENDMELLRDAGVGVAMGNASHRVKAAADAVTDGVMEDGILRVISDYFE